MRTAEAIKIIESDPMLKLRWLILNKKSGHVIEIRAGKLWREHIVKKGIAKFKVYYNDKIIKRGVVK